jgi:hypothetical protein
METLEVDRTVVGATTTSFTRMELLVKDVLISETIHGTAMTSLIPTNAIRVGNVLISFTEDVNKTKRERAMEATLPANNTANHIQKIKHTNAISLHGLVMNVENTTHLIALAEEKHAVMVTRTVKHHHN